MSYVKRSDYSRVISNQDLDDILQDSAEYFANKTSSQVLQEAGDMAEAKIRMVISARYDVEIEFSKSATDSPDIREKNVLRCYLHMAVYWLHFVINPRDIPELRQNAYDNCVKELELARDDNASLELEGITGTGRLEQISGAKKFVSKPYADPLYYDSTSEDE